MVTPFINASQLPLTPYGTQVAAPAAKVTPPWLPWAIGAAVGGGVLYLLLRRGA